MSEKDQVIEPGPKRIADVALVIQVILWEHEIKYGERHMLQSELHKHLWDSGIDPTRWLGHPEVKRLTGIRAVPGRVHEGAPDWFYVLDAKEGA